MEKNIELGKRYFMRMRPSRELPFIGWSYTTSDREKWVECEVVENDVPDSITLQPLEKGYVSKDFLLFYFQSYIKGGLVIEKTREDQHVEFIKWFESLTPTVCIEHSGFIVV